MPDLREGFPQRIAVVVIADQKAIRHRHLLQLRRQEPVGAGWSSGSSASTKMAR
jgi:hypothetical protein